MNRFIALAVLLIALPAPAGQITVTGKCRKKLKPDRASLTFNVEFLAPKPADAQKKVNAIAGEITKAFKKMDFKDYELSTSNLSLDEQIVYENNKPRSKGFSASHSMTLTSSEIARVGDAVPTALEAGARSFGGLRVYLSDAAYDKAYQGCLAQATEDAKLKAQKILDGQNKKVGELTELFEGQPSVAIPYAMGGGAMDAQAMSKSAPSIEVRDSTVEAIVTAKFGF